LLVFQKGETFVYVDASKPGATPTYGIKTKGITFVNNKLLLKNSCKK
jgi:hypothetical protein